MQVILSAKVSFCSLANMDLKTTSSSVFFRIASRSIGFQKSRQKFFGSRNLFLALSGCNSSQIISVIILGPWHVPVKRDGCGKATLCSSGSGAVAQACTSDVANRRPPLDGCCLTYCSLVLHFRPAHKAVFSKLQTRLRMMSLLTSGNFDSMCPNCLPRVTHQT